MMVLQRLLLALLFGMIWTPAHALFPATSNPEWQGLNNGLWYPDLGTAAANSVGVNPNCGQFGLYRWSVLSLSPPNGFYHNWAYCGGSNNGFGGPVLQGLTARTVLACPTDSTLSGSTCTCNVGYAEQGGACVSQQVIDNAACNNLAAGLNLVGAPMVHYGASGLTACFGGYVMSGTGAASGGGQTELYGPFKCSGQNASSCSVVPKPPEIPGTCPAGTFPGTVNGLPVCAPGSTSVEAPKTTTTAPPAGGGPAPDIPGAPAGTTTEEKQTVCEGPTCTTTTTYKDGSGTSTGSKTETAPKSTYCAENPKAPGCESLEASTFAGNCDGGFTFKGDAIQGALAKEVHKQNCLMNKVTDESAKYDAAKVKTGDQTTDLPGNEFKAITSADIDQTNAIVGGTCIADRTININLIATTSTLVLPFSSICPLLDYFRLVLIALGFFIAYRIIGGR